MAHGWKWKRIWDPVFLGRIVLRYRIDLEHRDTRSKPVYNRHS